MRQKTAVSRRTVSCNNIGMCITKQNGRWKGVPFDFHENVSLKYETPITLSLYLHDYTECMLPQQPHTPLGVITTGAATKASYR